MDNKSQSHSLAFLAFVLLFGVTSSIRTTPPTTSAPARRVPSSHKPLPTPKSLVDAFQTFKGKLRAPATRRPPAGSVVETTAAPERPTTVAHVHKPHHHTSDHASTTEATRTKKPSTTKESERPVNLPDDKRAGAMTSGTEDTEPRLTVTRSMDERGVMKFLLHENGEACLKAKFKLALLITYPSRGKNKTEVPLTANLLPPRDVMIGGRCARANSTQPRIELEWGGGNYRLVLEFSTAMVPGKSSFDSQGEDGEEELEMVGRAETISFTYNMGDSNVFLHPVKAGIMTAHSTENGSFFQAPLNSSYRCSSPVDIPLFLKHRNDTVLLRMSDARIQTYNLKFRGKFGDEVICEADRISPSKNIIPIAVAGCLTGVIVIVVLAYFITKRTGRLGYTSMAE